MLKKTLKIFLFILLAFTLFSFWMSPRLGGLLPLGKEEIGREIFHLAFDSSTNSQHQLTYEDNSHWEHLVELRKEYHLDSLVGYATNDFDKIITIQNWVQSRWVHDSYNTPEKYNAVFILKAAEKGERFRCVEYSFVMGQCLSALGFKVRGLGLMTKDISDVKSGGGHVVNEVYLEGLKKWIMIDPQFALIPTFQGVPLNAVELQECIVNNRAFDILNPSKTTTKNKYEQWISPYLYYFTTTLSGQSVGIKDRILGNKKQLTLYPLGAEQPTYFQKIFRLNTSYYTHSINDFYPEIN